MQLAWPCQLAVWFVCDDFLNDMFIFFFSLSLYFTSSPEKAAASATIHRMWQRGHIFLSFFVNHHSYCLSERRREKYLRLSFSLPRQFNSASCIEKREAAAAAKKTLSPGLECRLSRWFSGLRRCKDKEEAKKFKFNCNFHSYTRSVHLSQLRKL